MTARHRLLASFFGINALLIAVAVALLLSRAPQPPQIHGVLLPDARAVDDFRLLDHRGDAFTQRELRGRWHLVSYGFTTCPDICPATLAELATVTRALEKQDRADDVGVLFYTVDYRRDTPDKLASYVSYFHPKFVGLTRASDADTAYLPFEQGLGITAQLIPGTGPGAENNPNDYEVLHSVTVLLLNPEGKLQAVFQPERRAPGMEGFTADTLLRDYLAVRDYLG